MSEQKMIWQTLPDVDALNALHENTAVAHLGIVVTAAGPNYLAGTMPVDQRTRQPFGLLHGGATVLLLETLASAASNHCVAPQQMCVGLEVNCNHIRGVSAGLITGRAEAVHIGRSSLVWSLSAHDQKQRLVATGRLTAAVVAKPAG
jgi:1,4-dihydroxy-2-naphthoyl-CoA hydrolase